jgi:hypothetical protein
VSVRHLDQRTALSRVTLVARRDIEPGEELTISYVDPSLGVRARREKLGAWNFGTCTCVKCVEDEKTGEQEGTNNKGMDDMEKELKAGLGVQ